MNEWINLQEKTPNQNETVLCSDGKGVFYKMYDDGIFYDGFSHFYCFIGLVPDITHWMPLPKPPELKDE